MEYEYLNFDLEISDGKGQAYPVKVDSPAGQAVETMHFPYKKPQLESHLKDLTIALLRSSTIYRQKLSTELQSVQDMGKALFNALFTGEIRTRYDSSQSLAQERGKGLRVRLRINPAHLSALPWEYLYDPRDDYLCLSSRTPLVRYLEVSKLIPTLTVNLPLRVLGMICSPSDLPELDMAMEKRRMEEALSKLQADENVELTWLSKGSWSDLQDALADRDRSWHVFHFIGHGGFDSAKDEGYIVLKGADGKSHDMYATELARLLADRRDLRLVILNACQGAQAGWESIYSSVASMLVRRGIACTIAMQFPITDRAAIELTRWFYTMLAKGLPVDAALAEARKALSIDNSNSVEWGTPVLFMRSPDGKLFHPNTNHAKKIISQKTDEAATLPEDQPITKQPEGDLTPTKNPAGSTPAEITPESRIDLLKKADRLYRRGMKNLSIHQYERAIEDFTQALLLNQANAKAYYNRGLVHSKMGQHEKAIQDYTQALLLNAKYADAYFQRGLSYVFGGKYERAIVDFDVTVKLRPKHAEAHFQLGSAYGKTGQYEQAIKSFDQVLKFNPKEAIVYFNRGLAYGKLSIFKKAVEDLNQAINLNPNDAEYYNSRGTIYSALGQEYQAMLDFTEAMRIDPRFARAYFNRGLSNGKLGNHEQAIKDFSESINLNRKDGAAYYNRGVAYDLLGKSRQAIADFNQALKFNEKDAYAYFSRGIAHANLSQHELALQDYECALKFDPMLEDVYYIRAISYQSLAQKGKALADLHKVLEISQNIRLRQKAEQKIREIS